MSFLDCTDRYAVIGAGASGLTAVKNFRQQGIAVDCFEREGDLGGNWNYESGASSVYASTHLISSKRMTEFVDFPMPDHYPPYPSHRQALAYLRAYADEFRLREAIRFRTCVEHVVPLDGACEVRLAGEALPRRYRGAVIANGHHWDPLWPEIPGHFAGQVLHARQYKTPDLLRGKRVLVVGAGNSGCDIAVEAAQHADTALLSLRRGYHFLPKFLLGVPVDAGDAFLHRWHVPLWLRRWLTGWLVHIAVGAPERYGLPAPDHALFESHPIVNSQLLYFVGHGTVKPRPNIAEFRGRSVRFADGREDEVDLVIFATGYRLSFPFLDLAELNAHDGWPRLYLNVFHPRRDNLFVIGMIQPNGGLWKLADYQAQLAARFVAAQDHHPDRADWFRSLKSGEAPALGAGIRYLDSPRHRLEVEYFDYRDRLKLLIEQFPHR